LTGGCIADKEYIAKSENADSIVFLVNLKNLEKRQKWQNYGASKTYRFLTLFLFLTSKKTRKEKTILKHKQLEYTKKGAKV